MDGGNDEMRICGFTHSTKMRNYSIAQFPNYSIAQLLNFPIT
jgi:hypothetical protein